LILVKYLLTQNVVTHYSGDVRRLPQEAVDRHPLKPVEALLRPSKAGRRKAALASVVICSGMAVPAIALAYTSTFSGSKGPGGYIQSDPGHTFNTMSGTAHTSIPVACQFLNSSGVNDVTHDTFSCTNTYGGGAYVTARVYNQSSGTTVTLDGSASTP
jgi:hypothetical protein